MFLKTLKSNFRIYYWQNGCFILFACQYLRVNANHFFFEQQLTSRFSEVRINTSSLPRFFLTSLWLVLHKQERN